LPTYVSFFQAQVLRLGVSVKLILMLAKVLGLG